MNFYSRLRHSLKARLTLFTLTLFVVSIWALASYAGQSLHLDIERLLGEQQFSTATLVAQEINDELTDRLGALEAVAARITFEALNDPAALQTSLAARPVFQALFSGGSFVTGLDGVARASVPPSAGRGGRAYAQLDCIDAALRQGKATVGRPFMDPALSAPAVPMAAPIRDERGQVIGAVAGLIDLGKPNLLDKIMRGSHGKDGSYRLVAPQWRLVVASSDKRRVMETLPAAGINPELDRFIAGYEGSAVIVSTAGVEELSSVKLIPAAHWYVEIAMPGNLAFSPAHDMLKRVLLVAVSLTLLLGTLIWWMISRQLAPLQSTASLLSLLSDREQPLQALPTTVQDEVGLLITGFNRLLADLAQRQSDLKESEDRFRTLTEWAPEPLAVHDGDRFIYVNPAAVRMFGAASAQDLVGQPILDRIHPDSRDLVRERLRVSVEQVDHLPMNEQKLLRLDGSTIDAEVQRMQITYDGARALQVSFHDVTERVRIAAQVAASRARMLAIFDAALDAVIGMDSAGRITEWNGQAEAIFGWRADEVMGRMLHDTIAPPQHRAAHQQGLVRYIATGQSKLLNRRIEIGALHRNGTEFPVELSILPLKDDGGYHFTAFIADISERKRAEEERRIYQTELEMQNENLRQAQLALDVQRARYFDLYDLAPIGYLSVSAEGLILEVNLSAARLLGQERQDLVQQPLSAFVSRSNQDTYYLLRRQLLDTRETQTCELEMKQRDGQPFWVRLAVSLTRNVDDAVELRIVINDISERKRAEEELRIAAIAFDSQLGMTITNAQNVILRVNKAFTEITGYTAEEAIGQTPSLLGSGRHDPAFYAAMWDSIKRTGEWQGEVWDRRKNGTVYPQLLTISSVRNEAGVLTHYVGTFSDGSSAKAAEEQIEALAFSDLLTGLPNRRMLIVQLQRAMIAGERERRQGALLLVDLDNFRNLNDALGHEQGDLLLQQFAARLSTSVREGETVARLGGDEFVVLLEQLDQSPLEAAMHAETAANKILAALRQPYQVEGAEISCSASIGIALFGERHEDTVEPLKRAELAMYEAKAHGRNTLRFFDPRMQAVVSERVTMEAGLREAIEKNHFMLHYQAQVTERGRVIGAEALLRWNDPRQGMVSPAEFVPLAEETGLILPIGNWVLESACRQLALWAKEPALAQLTLAVNVSAKQFHQRDFADQVLSTLHRTGAKADRLKLEMTESLLVTNVEDVIAKMNALKDRGVTFSLDDFGTGYSSLTYLKRLPLDQLKIDQGFVRDILSDANDAAIARMVVALAESMGLSVIAEGVETEAQRDFLSTLGCHHYQGYLFSRPVPIQAFEALATRA